MELTVLSNAHRGQHDAGHCWCGLIHVYTTGKGTTVQEALRSLLVRDMSRALLLAAGAFLVTLIFGRYWLSVLRRYRIGKRVRVDGHKVISSKRVR
jgi:hypothetical protein